MSTFVVVIKNIEHMKRFWFLLVGVVMVCVFGGCKNDDGVEIVTEKVKTGETDARITITYEYPVVLTKAVVYVSDNKTLKAADIFTGEIKDKSVKFEIDDLEMSTKYYYRYWFTDGTNVMESDIRNFKTKGKGGGSASGGDEGGGDEGGGDEGGGGETPEPEVLNGTENGHAWLGMGTSVRWATMNVGATAPTDTGYYYAWGETETKSNYTWSTYKWCSDDNGDQLTKYKSAWDSSQQKYVYDYEQLQLTDDVARTSWGGNWRMPTKAEIAQLNSSCEWAYVTQNGVRCWRVTAQNGNVLYFPMVGLRYENGLYGVGTDPDCVYWTSTLSDGNDKYAITFALTHYSHYLSNDEFRKAGFVVRPVCSK